MKTSKPFATVAFVVSILSFLLNANLCIAQKVQAEAVVITQKVFSWPLQVEMRIPFQPTSYHSGTQLNLIYELYLTNFGTSAIHVNWVEVVGTQSHEVVSTFDSSILQTMMQPLGLDSDDPKQKLTLQAGQTSIVFLEIKGVLEKPMPAMLIHRLITDLDTLEGATISTEHTRLQVISAPVEGRGWTADDGPGNSETNHHRRGVLTLGGSAVNSRRFAIDWKQYQNGSSFSGNSRVVQDYYCYGKNVYAVSNGRVITAKDGLPNNIPGHGEQFHPAVPTTFQTIAGNNITIDIGYGQYAYYMHLQPGSLLVKTGDRVKKGQLLARIGASGDAREPHLHFEITTSPALLRGEGIPYLIDRYSISPSDVGVVENHINELPADGQTVDFKNH